MSRKKINQDELAKEANDWENLTAVPKDWELAPEALPRRSASTPISIRMPTQLLEILKKIAKSQDIGYQVLIKRWLDDRLRAELKDLKHQKSLAKIAKPKRSRPAKATTTPTHKKKQSKQS